MDGCVPKKLAGRFHVLVLKLLAAGIIELDVAEGKAKNIGTDKLLSKHIIVRLGKRRMESGLIGLAILQPETWADI